jgi:2'-5' RNA ligase
VMAVHREAEAAARHIGLEPETKNFRPHITVGRLRDPRDSGDLAACLERECAFHAGDNVVRRVALLESTLSPQGAKYSLIREFPLVWIT